jgi:serine/threonine-protein kinase
MLGRAVAIKVIHPHLLADEQSVARFYNEARAASRLNHPNSVSIIDFGRTDDGILYLAMEYLQGRDLARVIRDEGPLALPRICELLNAVLAALGEAHALGVIHRDLKPENVIIERLRTGTDLVKVVDFGLAKLHGGGTALSSVTSPGLVCGTPDYMSPEQGRGLAIDGRSDIYAVGVMLFELLTEQLPFIADTPTNVVLRHIQDPIPDPRDFAPERGIPAALADVVHKGLAKAPEDRYQTAADMADALRQILTELQPAAPEIACPTCGVNSPSSKRFCGECGAAIQPQEARSISRPRMSLPPRMAVASGERAVLAGRQHEMQRLTMLRDVADGGLMSVCLVGESGIGKTRLLAEVAALGAREGDLVVGAGPHDSGAAIPYHPIRTMLLSLLACDVRGLSRMAEELAATEPLVSAGMFDVIEPAGLRGALGRSRSGAVAAALAFGLRHALHTTGKTRALLIVDDLHRCDGLSAQVLGALAKHTGDLSLFLVTACQQAPNPSLPEDTQSVLLRGLTMHEARAYMGGYAATPALDGISEERTYIPLFLEQLRALGLALDAVPHTLPRRLADAVAQRMQRLSLPARRVLQAACVLGNRCHRDQLLGLAELGDHAGFEQLKGAGLLVEQDGSVEVVHPFIRDLVEASIPAEARKALHVRALDAEAEADAPLEVRAHHAYGGGETLTALMLLERTGDMAFERGDAVSAVPAYRQALDLVRRELLESGEMSLEGAVASFSCKLGNALARIGDVTGAEGVLREGLEFTEAKSATRALILLGLGRVVATRKRLRDAYRMLGEALEIAIQRDDQGIQAAIHLAIGELRVTDANLVGAVGSFSAAVQRLSAPSGDAIALASAAVKLATVLARGTDQTAARDALIRAQEISADADAPCLQAQCLAAQGELREGQGDHAGAQACLRMAWQLVAQAGDADAAIEYAAGLARYNQDSDARAPAGAA